MYAGTAIMFVGLPLWRESYAGTLAAGVPIAMRVLRIPIEERFLPSKLTGHDAYSE